MNARTEPNHLSTDAGVLRLRVPPHSSEAEQSVLGALLLDNAAADRIEGTLRETDFYAREHRLIFAAISLLLQANKPADVVTTFEALGAEAQDCGGLAYLNSLAQCVPSAANIRRYAEIVRERALLRASITAADAVVAVAFADGAKAADVLELASSSFGRLERTGQRVEPKSLAEIIGPALDRYQAGADGGGARPIPTGIAPLDRLLNGGLRPGKLYGIAARPSVGKSSAARSIALHAAGRGHTVLLLSQEMPQDEVVDCVLAELGGIDGTRLQSAQLQADDWSRLADAADRAILAPLHIDDQGGLRLPDVRAKARSIKGLGLLVVDYLQLMTSTLRNATTNDQIAEISKGLKALAMELKIPVIVLSQLNREVEKRADREPQLSDLRDSGAIEQDLDVAVMLWTVREDDDSASRLVGWKVAKHRGGRKGRFGMRFDAPRYRWAESAESIDPPKGISRGRGGDL